jgi:hypothetical protein
MTRLVDISLARQVGANRSRRQARGTSWRAPLWRARRAIRSTMARVETSERVIDATARFAAGRPLETSRRLLLLGECIEEAGACLQRAIVDVEKAVRLAEEEPDKASAAPALLALTTLQWFDAAARLDESSARIAKTSACLLSETLQRGAQPLVPTQRPARVRCAPVRHAPVVLIRRRWLVTAFAAEVAIEISRGRAPPLAHAHTPSTIV